METHNTYILFNEESLDFIYEYISKLLNPPKIHKQNKKNIKHDLTKDKKLSEYLFLEDDILFI